MPEPTSLRTHIAGAQFRKGVLKHLKELNKAFENSEFKNYTFELEREPGNKYDTYAVKILDPQRKGEFGEDTSDFIGYVPKDWSYEVSRIMDSGGTATCTYAGKHRIVIELSDGGSPHDSDLSDEGGVDTDDSGQ